MMENWVADSKRGQLRHTPTGSAATLNQWKSEKMRQETPCNTLGDTREGSPHNATTTARTSERANWPLLTRPTVRGLARLPPLPFGHRPLPVSSPFAGASPAMRKVMFRAVCPGARSDLAPAPVAGVENIDIDKLINQHVNGPNGITVYRLP